MSVSEFGNSHIVSAKADVAIAKGELVRLTSTAIHDFTVDLATTTSTVWGVAAEDAAAGDTFNVITHGPCEVKLAGTIAANKAIASNASGRGTAASAGGYYAAMSRVDGVSGDLQLADLSPGYAHGSQV